MQSIFMRYSTSTNFGFRHRETAVIMVFSMPKNQAEDQLLRFQHSEILWQPDMRNQWASLPLGFSLDLSINMDSLDESLAKDFQHNFLSAPEIYPVGDLSSTSFLKSSVREDDDHTVCGYVSLWQIFILWDLQIWLWLFLERGLTPSSINSSFL